MSKISSSESYVIWEEIIGKARLEDGREPLFRGYFAATIFAFENLRQGLSAKLEKELAELDCGFEYELETLER